MTFSEDHGKKKASTYSDTSLQINKEDKNENRIVCKTNMEGNAGSVPG